MVFRNVSSPYERQPYLRRRCVACGAVFVTQNPTRVFCLDRCSARLRMRALAERRRAQHETGSHEQGPFAEEDS